MTTTSLSDAVFYDPVLRTYRVMDFDDDQHIYNISGFFSPISIKDQIIRAHQMIERALLHNILDNRDKRLLIVGGGIAGMAAALKAKENNIRCTLIEKTPNLGGHVMSSRRHTCPTQYDWTAEHWLDGAFALYRGRPELDLVAGNVVDIKTVIEDEFSELTAFTSPIALRLGTGIDMKEVARHNGRLKIFFHQTGVKPIQDIYDMILICAGFPQEKTYIQDTTAFYGLPFWALFNHRDFHNLGKSSKETDRILLCGGGDGSLQDFLLFATVADPEGTRDPNRMIRGAAEIYKYLNIPDKTKDRFEKAVTLAEDKAKRLEIWYRRNEGHFKELYCVMYEELHAVYNKWAEEILNERGIRDKMEKLLSPLGRRGKVHISLNCSHFTTCYPLNHFLSLLFVKYIKDKHKKDVLLYKNSVTLVESANKDEHQCRVELTPGSTHPTFDQLTTASRGCLRHLHKATFVKTDCINNGAVDRTDIYKFVFIRYGIEKMDNDAYRPLPKLPGLQYMPYFLP